MDYNAAANDPTVLVSLLSEIKGELSSLRNEIKEKDSKINSLEAALSKLQEEHKTDINNIRNELTDIKERMITAEMYMSKDTIIINNPPKCDNSNLIQTVVQFFNNVFGAGLQLEDIKAAHFLGTPGASSIIVKFLYFAQKKFIWRSKKLLRNVKNTLNNKPIYLAERLPLVCRELYHEARARGLRVVTNNSEVQVICSTSEGQSVFRPIHTMDELEKVEQSAIKVNSLSGTNPLSNQRNNYMELNTMQNRNKSNKRILYNKSGLTPENKVQCSSSVG